MINGLPKKLKAQRIKYGLSQKNVAEKLGVSPSIISGYETGERTPSVDALLSLSYLFNCSTDYLLGRKEEKQESLINISGLNDEQTKAIINLINSMK